MNHCETEMLRALYDFQSTIPQTINFSKGDFFILDSSVNNQQTWWQVISITGQVGIVPNNYVQTVEVGSKCVLEFLIKCIKALEKENQVQNSSRRQELIGDLNKRRHHLAMRIAPRDSRSPVPPQHVSSSPSTPRCSSALAFASNSHAQHNADIFTNKHLEEEVKKLVSDLQGIIECPVCLGRMESSLRQCTNGHGICVSCSNKVRVCPLCQCSFLPNKPIMIANILERLPKLCSFTEKCCDKVLLYEHEAFCKFRTTSCKIGTCDWIGTVEAAPGHALLCNKGNGSLNQVYYPNVKVTQVYKFVNTQNAAFYSAMIFENQLFWKYCKRYSTTKNIIWRFFLVAPSKPKKKYYLVVSFSKGGIEFTTCVQASYETDRDLQETENYKASLFLSDENLQRFYDSKAEGYVCTEYIVVENIGDEK